MKSSDVSIFTASQPNGILIAKHALSTYASSPTQTEIIACYETVKWVISHNYNMVCIFSDCFNAIMQIVEKAEYHFHDTFLVRNMAAEVSKLPFCQISKVARHIVQRAHILAKHALDFFVSHPDNGVGVSFQPSILPSVA